MDDVPVEQPEGRQGHGWAVFFAGSALLAATLIGLWWFLVFGMRCVEGCTESDWSNHQYSWQWISLPTSGLLTFAAVIASIVVARKSGSRSKAAILTYCVTLALALLPWVVAVTYQPPITAHTLLSSMQSKLGQEYGYGDSCERRSPSTWSCWIGVTSDEVGAGYTVTTTPEHCWNAQLKRVYRGSTTRDGQLWPSTTSGCTTVLSVL